MMQQVSHHRPRGLGDAVGAQQTEPGCQSCAPPGRWRAGQVLEAPPCNTSPVPPAATVLQVAKALLEPALKSGRVGAPRPPRVKAEDLGNDCIAALLTFR